ncbi:MAG: sensor histidine kinase [Acetivibrio sp.]
MGFFMSFFHNMKIRKKLILTYLVVSIVPITLLGLLCYQETRELLLEKEGYKQEESLQQVAASLDNQIQIYNNLSDYIAFNQTIEQVINYKYQNYYDMYEKYTNLLDPLLASLKYFHNDVKRVTIYTKNTTVEHDTTIAPLDNIKDFSWYQKVCENPGILWFVDENGNAFLARQLPKDMGVRVDGILYIDVKYKKLFEPMENLVDSNYGICVMNENGTPLFEKNMFEQKYKGEILSAKTLRDFDGGKYENLRAQYMISKDTVESCGWTLYLYKPMKIISTSANSIAWTVLFVALICIFIVAAVGYGMSYFMFHRLENLNKNMEQVENGNIKAWVSSDSDDEIGELIRSFEKMIGKIQFLIQEVYQSEITLKEFEMKALQAQINPHFLYNSLSVINWKALAANEKEISRLTLLLSSFYRTTLNKGKNTILVCDELKNMDAYLEIQLIMHDYSFDVVRNIDSEIVNHAMPNLMLQPIVENAIGHGIDLKEEGRGCLTITGKQKKDTFVFTIEDNGVGIDEKTIETILTFHTKGYGVKNVNERIGLLYGKEYGLHIESKKGEGTRVVMELPNSLKENVGGIENAES